MWDSQRQMGHPWPMPGWVAWGLGNLSSSLHHLAYLTVWEGMRNSLNELLQL